MTDMEPIFWDIETTGLNPMAQYWWDGKMAARVTAIGIGRLHGWRDADDYSDVDAEVKCLYDGDEYNLLKVFTDRLESHVADINEGGKSPFIVGWNSRQFDHPYIGARYARLRLSNEWVNNSLHRLDMMRPLGDDDVMSKRYPSQDDYAEALGIEVYDELDGSDMPKAYERGEWHKIKQHVEADVDVMMKVFFMKAEACYEELYHHYDGISGSPPKFTEGATY
jgi:uncharacterized protein YprB with RNaseH-like and TPR domain